MPWIGATGSASTGCRLAATLGAAAACTTGVEAGEGVGAAAAMIAAGTCRTGGCTGDSPAGAGAGAGACCGLNAATGAGAAEGAGGCATAWTDGCGTAACGATGCAAEGSCCGATDGCLCEAGCAADGTTSDSSMAGSNAMTSLLAGADAAAYCPICVSISIWVLASSRTGAGSGGSLALPSALSHHCSTISCSRCLILSLKSVMRVE